MRFFDALYNCDNNARNVSITVIDGEFLGEKALISNGDAVYFSSQDGFLAANRDELAGFNETGVFALNDSLVYVENIAREKKIVICGAGHVSMPIIRFVKMLGFHVTVIDDRDLFVKNAERAGADVVICGNFTDSLKEIPGGLDTYFIVVTRGHTYDSECLRVILKKTFAYVGMMGSKRRSAMVDYGLINEGYLLDDVMKIHSPIGLAIGAETPEEIAISIMAEIIQEKNDNHDSEFPAEILRYIINNADTRKVLCTIISKQGAGPRDVGTKMLCIEDGKIIGTIGGGLMEAQVIERAAEMFTSENPAPVLMCFNLTAGAFTEEGEVCGGVIQILLERIE